MSDNPLEMTPERQGRIDARATQLWEAEGSPPNKMADYKERADELIRMEDSAGTGQLPNPMTKNEPIPGVMVEEASIQENLGEFPGNSVSDQGEWRETPMTREEQRHGDQNPANRPEGI